MTGVSKVTALPTEPKLLPKLLKVASQAQTSRTGKFEGSQSSLGLPLFVHTWEYKLRTRKHHAVDTKRWNKQSTQPIPLFTHFTTNTDSMASIEC